MANSKKYFVTAIGNSIIDVLVFIKEEYLEKNGLKKGSMSLVDQNNAISLANLKYNKISAGGSVANTIVSMANLGVKNAFIGKVGSGHYGEIFNDDLIANNVDFYCKTRSAFGSTARSFILITPDSERTMCTYLGESANVEIDAQAIQDSQILYIEGYLWHEKSTIDALKQAMSIAKKSKTKIAFTLCDAGWVDLHKADFLKIVNVSDIVFGNEEEVKALISADEIDYEKIKKLGETNKNLILVITRSEKSAIIYNAKTQEFIEVKANKVENIVDSTGSGDAFAAGFLYGLNQNFSLEESAQIGHLFASQIIQVIGGRFGKEQIENIEKTLQISSRNVA